MNERHLVEQALLISMLSNVVERGASDLTSPEVIAAAQSLRVAIQDVLDQAPKASQAKLVRRISGHGKRCITPQITLGSQIALLGLAAHAILEHLINEDYLVIGEQSTVSHVLDSILQALEPAAAIEGNIEKGKTIAKAIFSGLQREGLFRDVRSFT